MDVVDDQNGRCPSMDFDDSEHYRYLKTDVCDNQNGRYLKLDAVNKITDNHFKNARYQKTVEIGAHRWSVLESCHEHMTNDCDFIHQLDAKSSFATACTLYR